MSLLRLPLALRLSLIAVIAFRTLVVLAAPGRGEPESAETAATVLEQAFQAFALGRYGLSEQLYRHAATLDPSSDGR